MSNLFDAQTKDQIESRMVQTLHTLTETDKTAIEGSFTRDMIDTNAVEFENSYEAKARSVRNPSARLLSIHRCQRFRMQSEMP